MKTPKTEKVTIDNVTIPLHVLFVDSKRRLLREMYSECILSRQLKTMTYISIHDEMLLDVLDCGDKMPMPFYDIELDRFNFKCKNLMNLMNNDEELPDEIILEIMEVRDDDGYVTYIHLEPGLWKENEEGKYRVSDDSLMHIVMDLKVLPMVKDNMVSFKDGGAMTLFFYLTENFSIHFFNRDIDDEEDDEWDIEDDDECKCNCDNCCICDIEDDEDDDECDCFVHNILDDTDDNISKINDNDNKMSNKKPDVESLYPNKFVVSETKLANKNLDNVITNRVSTIKNKIDNTSIRHFKRRK